jgi:hypothetical protein
MSPRKERVVTFLVEGEGDECETKDDKEQPRGDYDLGTLLHEIKVDEPHDYRNPNRGKNHVPRRGNIRDGLEGPSQSLTQ